MASSGITDLRIKYCIIKLKLDLLERSVRRLDLNTTETIIYEDMKMLSRLEFTHLNIPEVNRKW